jgi:long-chain acyl-CoA synthetase
LHLETVAQSLIDATAPLVLRKHLCLLPLATLLENVAGVLAPLLAGARCVVPPPALTGIGSSGLDVPQLLATLTQQSPDSIILVPELLRVLVDATARGWSPPASLRFVAVGGAVVAPALLARAIDCGLPVHEGYGLSECCSVVCLNMPGASRLGSVGRELPHARVRVDTHGEIHVRGPTMLGYVGDAARAVGASFATGDLGQIDADGFLYVLGRRRNVFITSFGRNVSPEWVEAEIAEQPGIAQVVVHGEGRPYVVALIVPTRADLDASTINQAVNAANSRLPSYARVRHWLRVPPFLASEGLATANGRLRRDAIEQRYRETISSLYVDALAS